MLNGGAVVLPALFSALFSRIADLSSRHIIFSTYRYRLRQSAHLHCMQARHSLAIAVAIGAP